MRKIELRKFKEKKKLRIAHVCPFYEPAIGGVKQVVEELAVRQSAEGHEVHIFTSDWDKHKRIKNKNEEINNVFVHRCFHWFKIANFGSFWPGVFLKVLFRKKRFDIVHTHVFGHPHVFFAALAGKLRGSRIFHTTHCPWSDAYRGLFGRVCLFVSYHTFSKWSLRMMEKIIAITPWENKFIEKYGGHKRIAERIVNIPNGMSEIFFKRIKKNGFKKKWGIPENAMLVLFFGRMNPTKSPDELVKVGKEILKERKSVYFVFRGPDEGMKRKIEGMIKEEKNMLLINETRDRREIAEMYQAADVFALPSYREGLPLTLFEAMASGVPIVASPVNGVPFEMKDGVNGFLVEHGQTKKWADAILRILDDNELAERFKKNNLKKAEEYDWNKIAKRIMGLYLENKY